MTSSTLRLTRRAFLGGAAALGLGLSACANGGHFSILGYTTRPNYDENIHTVYVPVFRTRIFESGPLRGFEFVLTEAVQREIEMRTPYKVVSCREGADTELLGTVVNRVKAVTNLNQQNEVREAEITIGVEIVWRDLRTGELLSQPKPNGPEPPPVVFDPNSALEPLKPPAPTPVLISSNVHMIPEVGQSMATTLQTNADRLARQVVNMMEKPW